MTVRDMKELVERLGILRKELKTLETEEAGLVSELKEGLLKKGYGYEVESEHYLASLSPTKVLEIDEDKLFRNTLIGDYRKCCKPQVTQCRKVLSEETLIKVSEEKEGKDKLNLKPRV